MKNLFLGAVLVLLGIFILVMCMAMPEAGATPIDPIYIANAALYPEAVNQPIAPISVLFSDSWRWEPVTMSWISVDSYNNPWDIWSMTGYYFGAPIVENFYGESYRIYGGTVVEGGAGPSQTPIPPSALLLATGLVGFAWFRRRIKV